MDKLKQTRLGSEGLVVPAIGLGCMGMTPGFGFEELYGKTDEKEAIATIHRSLELGGNFLDTADAYGPFLNEQLIAKAMGGNRSQYIIATKFGIEVNDEGAYTGLVNGKANYVRKAVERSLKNLQTDYIDLYYLHRLDKTTPVEETVAALAELVKEGKVRYIGLSEVSSATIRKAHKVHPLTAVQTEYSLFERSLEEDGIYDTLNQLGIGLVAYSPLGRGFLSGQFRSPDDYSASDFRRHIPKTSGDQFYKNLELLKEIEAMAAEKGITSTQLALAWVMAKGAVPIPGTKRVKYVESNIAATKIELTPKDMDHLESIIPLGAQTGARYGEAGMQQVD
ncbi:aldo/keto reductase [Dinghuibacter silviterrae]|uniref:Aryl-alcohol dehydrogenase-like predicted oxidoreductase n=1 Tax=Dinghuibacter silviterrae TaxID=1539049 RepID=A0A4R8DFA3_9BACT|nr:aldo/keto reductase [Dinghuibacter silviterrae]TDW96273.1 aryl-alcohol dehydrogenase-like predicted oxidoreductase [Dinghuibacter silviterrae]